MSCSITGLISVANVVKLIIVWKFIFLLSLTPLFIPVGRRVVLVVWTLLLLLFVFFFVDALPTNQEIFQKFFYSGKVKPFYKIT